MYCKLYIQLQYLIGIFILYNFSSHFVSLPYQLQTSSTSSNRLLPLHPVCDRQYCLHVQDRTCCRHLHIGTCAYLSNTTMRKHVWRQCLCTGLWACGENWSGFAGGGVGWSNFVNLFDVNDVNSKTGFAYNFEAGLAIRIANFWKFHDHTEIMLLPKNSGYSLFVPKTKNRSSDETFIINTFSHRMTVGHSVNNAPSKISRIELFC